MEGGQERSEVHNGFSVEGEPGFVPKGGGTGGFACCCGGTEAVVECILEGQRVIDAQE